MTKTFGYDFMDLLKDNNLVPATDFTVGFFDNAVANIKSLIAGAAAFQVAEYDFMDLVHDKGLVPNGPANDNDFVRRVA